MRCPASIPLMTSVLAVWLAALQGCGVTAAPNGASPLQSSGWGNPRRYIHLQCSTEFSTSYLEISINGHVRKSAHRGSYSVILLKAESRDRIAIFGVKSKRFVCMDAGGNLFTSTICNKDDCLFHHKLLENNLDVYYSTKTGLLLNLDGAKQTYAADQNLPPSSLFLSEKNTVPLERLQLRERRNRRVDPSDPSDPLNAFREESDSRAAQEEDADQDFEPSEDRNISRETVVSPNDDDPWDLIRARSPSSPRISGTVG